jgi:metallo-beta-lactamase family protein
MIKLKFYGGCIEVTGSLHLLEIDDLKLLLDCGMRQGGEERKPLMPNSFKDIDAVVLSHAHIDHSGLLPYIYSMGFEGKIFSTVATRELCTILLLDSAKIQKDEYLNRGKPILYTEEDVSRCLSLFKVVDYNTPIQIDDVEIIFRDAGHILGSSICYINVEGFGSIVYSGDIGHGRSQILNPPSNLGDVDILILESTYGGKLHPRINPREELSKLIEEVLQRRGKLLIPVFAVGRAQEILFLIRGLWLEGKLPDVKIYLDSPMAMNSTDLYSKFSSYLKPEFRNEYFLRNISPFDFEAIEYIKSHDVSLDIARSNGPAIILAASGMLEGGRILNHLPGILKDPNSMICFVGYQAVGTLGREILDGKRKIHIDGESFEVKCGVKNIPVFSAHADHNDLINFISSAEFLPRKIFLVHGELDALNAVNRDIKKLKIRSMIVTPGYSEDFIGIRIKRVLERDVVLEFKPSFISLGDKQIAPFVGAFIKERGDTIKIVSKDRFIALMDEIEREIEGELRSKIPMLESQRLKPLEAQVISYEEARVGMQQFFKKRILSRKRLREFKEKLYEEGRDALISHVNSLATKNRLYVEDRNVEEELRKFLVRVISSIAPKDLIALMTQLIECDKE